MPRTVRLLVATSAVATFLVTAALAAAARDAELSRSRADDSSNS